MLRRWNYRMKRSPERFEMVMFGGYAPCVTMQQSCPDLLKIERQLNAITNNPSPRILKMPEHCMGWQPSLSMRVIP